QEWLVILERSCRGSPENEELLKKLMVEFHSSTIGDHARFLRTYAQIATYFYWPGMRRTIREFVRHFQICQRAKSRQLHSAGLFSPLPIPNQVWEDVAMDFIACLPTSKGGETLVQIVVKLHGIPRSIVSNRDKVFASAFWSHLFKLQGDPSATHVPLPLLSSIEGPLLQLVKILDTRKVQLHNEWEIQVLVQWDGTDEVFSTWIALKGNTRELGLLGEETNKITMGDANPNRTLGDYSKLSHEGYRNTIELPVGNNVALGTSIEARVRDYMASHTERMERFENAIFKQREEINDRMVEMFGLFKELTTSRAPKKVLIREEARSPVTKNVNSISLTKREEERNSDNEVVTGDDIKKLPEQKWRFNDSLSGARVGKIKGRTYNLLPGGLFMKQSLEKITMKEDIGGNFKIPCNIGGLKHMNALVDQGSDVNVIPLSTYVKLTDERPVETNIRLSLASHSYIYPLGIEDDILEEVVEHVYPVDFVILDIKENKKRPFILGTSFLTTAKAVIKFDKGTITLRSRKNKISFNRIPESFSKDEKEIKNYIKPIALQYDCK
nr:hypothetical protein [Tanacetum cinerariifolium]